MLHGTGHEKRQCSRILYGGIFLQHILFGDCPGIFLKYNYENIQLFKYHIFNYDSQIIGHDNSGIKLQSVHYTAPLIKNLPLFCCFISNHESWYPENFSIKSCLTPLGQKQPKNQRSANILLQARRSQAENFVCSC